jgi:predicted component of type VI protein secretion system
MTESLRIVSVGPLPPLTGGMANQAGQPVRLLAGEVHHVTPVRSNAPCRPAPGGRSISARSGALAGPRAGAVAGDARRRRRSVARRARHAELQRHDGIVDIFAYPRLSMFLTELVTPLNPLEAFVQALLHMLDQWSHRPECRKRGWQFVAREHNWAAGAARYGEVFGWLGSAFT